MEKAQKLTPKPLIKEASLQVLNRLTPTQKKGLLSRISISKLVHHIAFTVIYRLLAIVAGVIETGLGIWRAVRGFQTGNTGVMVGAGLEAAGAALLLAATLIAFGVLAGPVFWIALLGAAFFVG